MIFSSDAFLRAFGIITLSEVVDLQEMDCLFRSYLLDVVVDVVAESVSIFPFKERHEHVIDLILLLLDVTKLEF